MRCGHSHANVWGCALWMQSGQVVGHERWSATSSGAGADPKNIACLCTKVRCGVSKMHGGVIDGGFRRLTLTHVTRMPAAGAAPAAEEHHHLAVNGHMVLKPWFSDPRHTDNSCVFVDVLPAALCLRMVMYVLQSCNELLCDGHSIRKHAQSVAPQIQQLHHSQIRQWPITSSMAIVRADYKPADASRGIPAAHANRAGMMPQAH